MRKIFFWLFFIVLILFVFFASSFQVFAGECTVSQEVPNCFRCEWTGIACVANPASNAYPPFGCLPGFEVDSSHCESLDYDACMAAGSNGFWCNEIGSDACYVCETITDTCYPVYPGDSDYPGAGCPGMYENAISCQANCDPGPIPPPEEPEPEEGKPYDVCQENDECNDCFEKGDSWTALGCIETSSPEKFIGWLLKRAIGIAGGIALLLIIFAGFRIITSAGDPKNLQAGKEMLTSAIIGLVVIIFSLFLLQLIGIQILQIPGFE